MTESILLVAAMVLMLVAIPRLSKYQDIRQATVDASRYATWQMTVSEAASREQIVDRMFSTPSAAIQSENTTSSENPYWRLDRRPLVREHALIPVYANETTSDLNAVADSIVDIENVSITTTERSASTGAVANAIASTVRTVSGWFGDSDEIAPNRGIVNSKITVGLNRNSSDDTTPVECSVVANDCLSISSSMLVDGWQAEDSLDIERGVQTMVPTTLLKPIGRVLSLASAVPLLEEFKDIDESFGCVNTSTLPTKEMSGQIVENSEQRHEC